MLDVIGKSGLRCLTGGFNQIGCADADLFCGAMRRCGQKSPVAADPPPRDEMLTDYTRAS